MKDDLEGCYNVRVRIQYIVFLLNKDRITDNQYRSVNIRVIPSNEGRILKLKTHHGLYDDITFLCLADLLS